MGNSVVGKKSGRPEYVDVSSLMRDDVKRAKLQSYIDEVLVQRSKVLDAQLQIKAIRDTAVDELNVEPKMFTNLVGLFFNNNFEQKLDEINRLEQAINTLMQVTPSLKGLEKPSDE